MQNDSVVDQLNELDELLFGKRFRTILEQGGPPFDISRPNIHDSKKEFLRELNTVQAIDEHCHGILGLLVGSKYKGDLEHAKMIGRLRSAIELSARQDKSRKPAESATDLTLRNLAETGFYNNALFVLIDLLVFSRQRLKELKDQEAQFWSVPHRPPNYYARTIALRFARLYAKEKRAKPTFGISSEGNHPSTDFGRALEQVFSILSIKANVRKAAEWAIDQLTEEDWNPPTNALMGGLLSAAMGERPPQPGRNYLAEYSKKLE